ncbi:MSHA biogenesis protein MshJ [Malonomonas rubra DSM 5091]|uniref:MSHA biogenesis protein MshJ n=1 Tax=Malonomonas rubra DSM 5091 TaxID=1122189 RepID=A0A1M6M5I0_MALRU|nr:type II secretion system protein M [Malonomonas rubra]SHJ78744.1 MSHA biogenesis protein MshJ [Malonomonas rubra DSM 5091]
MKTASIKDLLQWYESRPLRERVMLLICLLVVLFFIWDTLVMNNLSVRRKDLQKQSQQLKNEITQLEARQQIAEGRKGYDPDRENRLKLEQLQQELKENRQQLESNIDSLISPQDMAELLKELLQKQAKLTLHKLENQPAEALSLGGATADADVDLGPVLYRHRLQLEFSGDYLATLEYLKKLEQLPRKLVWEDLEIKTQTYPRAYVRLSVYTLSMDRGWIGG